MTNLANDALAEKDKVTEQRDQEIEQERKKCRKVQSEKTALEESLENMMGDKLEKALCEGEQDCEELHER